ncbi:MAG: FAD-dependent oxidoreductase [Deltaproteobacteria bacterium]
MNQRIAVIGAGISGLAAGYELMKAGFKPVIFEKDSSVGGRMSSETVDGFVVEKAAYTFPQSHRSLTDFLRELSMEHSLVQTPGTSSTFIRGKEYQIKIGSPTDFLRYKLLSMKNKKDMVKLYLYAKSLGRHRDLVHPTEKSFELERVSTAEYLLQDYDEEILEYIADPIFCEIFLGRPENNSKLAFLATISNLARFKIFSFDTGMGMLPERLTRDLDVRLDSPVTEVCRKAGGEPYVVTIGGSHPETFYCDGIIFAVPSPLVPVMCDELPETVKEVLSQVPYAPSIVTAFALDKTYPGTSLTPGQRAGHRGASRTGEHRDDRRIGRENRQCRIERPRCLVPRSVRHGALLTGVPVAVRRGSVAARFSLQALFRQDGIGGSV